MLNKMILQGRLTKKPELSHTASNVAYANFTVAWSEKYKEVETKCFLRCKAWRNTAEFLEKYFTKGQEILIEGHMVTEEWDKDGQKQSWTICIADKINFCGPRSSSTSNEQRIAQQTNQAPLPSNDGFINVPDEIDEELPFV